ncbi:hypothetical protein ACHQM5_024553 [Ranunculus cassubicifolius]
MFTPSSCILALQIKAALSALRKIDNLPKPVVHSTNNAQDSNSVPEDGNRPIHDLLDWLWFTFGFQKGNVANQREHLILLLANVGIRNKPPESYVKLDDHTVNHLMDKFFKNYRSWCAYLHCGSNIKFPPSADRQQLELLYIALYLLIWGEASNIRFMPECLCYIFHNMAHELHGILFSNVHTVSGRHFQPVHQGEESFLREVVTPIYQVLRKEARRNKGGQINASNWDGQ